MRILGIDPALTVTGYGVVDCAGGKLALVEAGVIKTASTEPITSRLEKIFTALQELIKETSPQVAVLEKVYAHYRHPATAIALGQARGAICLACALSKVALVEYSATRVKKAVVGRGLAGKYQVQRMVASLLDISQPPRYFDVTDALALAIAHSYIGRAATMRQRP
jgi:crossover junction endodeoxyribonuclease RuvC